MSDLFATQAMLDALGQAVLLFTSDNRLLRHNTMAAALFGADLHAIRSEGWAVASQLLQVGIGDTTFTLDDVRRQALASDRPVRFHAVRNGEYLPCWMGTVTDVNSAVHTLISIEMPDWGVVGRVLAATISEMHQTIDSTVGHLNLIQRTLNPDKENPEAVKIARRISGFTRLISIHMKRTDRLLHMVERLEALRTGKLRRQAQLQKQKINLNDLIEDFIETLDEQELLDPETEAQDLRARISVELEGTLLVQGLAKPIRDTLRELVRNAMMYSLRGTPITIKAFARGQMAQLEVIDQGYGIRENDWERVFALYERGRQPQIISEFGYGMALHICLQELATINGKLWFSSDEGVGTTFSVMLPLWQ